MIPMYCAVPYVSMSTWPVCVTICMQAKRFANDFVLCIAYQLLMRCPATLGQTMFRYRFEANKDGLLITYRVHGNRE